MPIADVVAARTGHDENVAASDGPRARPRAGRPKRRTFTAEYKIRILEEYDNAESPANEPRCCAGKEYRGLCKTQFKKYKPMAARNEDKKVFSGLL